MELKEKECILVLLFIIFKLIQLVLQIFASVKSYISPLEDLILFLVFFFNITLMTYNLLVFLYHCKKIFRSKTKETILFITSICLYLLIVAFYVYHYLVKPMHTPNKYNETHSYYEENGTTVTTAASTETIFHYFSINNEEALEKEKFWGLFEMNLSTTHEITGIIYTVAIISLQVLLFIIIRCLKKIHTLIDQESAVDTRTDTQSLISEEEASSLSPEEIVNEEASSLSPEEIVNEEASSLPPEEIVNEEASSLPPEEIVNEEASSLSPEEIVNEERNTHDECEEEKKKESKTESFEILIPQVDD